MIIGLVGGGQLPIVIVDLSRGCQISLGVEAESQALVCMRVVSQARPIIGVKACGILGEGRGGVNGLITGEHAAPHEAVEAAIGGELKIAREVPVAYPVGEVAWDVREVRQDDYAANLYAGGEAKAYRRDHAEEPVTSDDEAKKFRIARTVTMGYFPGGVDQLKRFDVIDERLKFQAAAVDVGGERATDGEAIGASLFLKDT